MNKASDPLWMGNWITDSLDSFKNEQICELNLHNFCNEQNYFEQWVDSD